LLENVGAEINPVHLIRRIKNGLEIPGLKEALIKILQDFHLQISLLEGCRAILNADCSELGGKLQKHQTSGFFISGILTSHLTSFTMFIHYTIVVKTLCPVCGRQLQENPQSLILLFLCRHVVHASCVSGGDQLPIRSDFAIEVAAPSSQGMSERIAMFVFRVYFKRITNVVGALPSSSTSTVRDKITQGCPICYKKKEGNRT